MPCAVMLPAYCSHHCQCSWSPRLPHMLLGGEGFCALDVHLWDPLVTDACDSRRSYLAKSSWVPYGPDASLHTSCDGVPKEAYFSFTTFWSPAPSSWQAENSSNNTPELWGIQTWFLQFQFLRVSFYSYHCLFSHPDEESCSEICWSWVMGRETQVPTWKSLRQGVMLLLFPYKMFLFLWGLLRSTAPLSLAFWSNNI